LAQKVIPFWGIELKSRINLETFFTGAVAKAKQFTELLGGKVNGFFLGSLLNDTNT
jgi:hypothetical protein